MRRRNPLAQIAPIASLGFGAQLGGTDAKIELRLESPECQDIPGDVAVADLDCVSAVLCAPLSVAEEVRLRGERSALHRAHDVRVCQQSRPA
jgi:hypothetical protein